MQPKINYFKKIKNKKNKSLKKRKETEGYIVNRKIKTISLFRIFYFFPKDAQSSEILEIPKDISSPLICGVQTNF